MGRHHATHDSARAVAGRAVVSPELLPDGRITLRLRTASAKAVTLGGTLFGKMSRAGMGKWSITIGPLPPNVYTYHFTVDGASFADPANPWNHNGADSVLLVPEPAGHEPQPWELTDIPHGSVTIEYYTSPALHGVIRRCHVYTPPGYDPRADRRYPVLYLLHGHGDNDSNWTGTGRANFILDRLIDSNQAVPMVVVMPDGGSLFTMRTSTFVDDVLHGLIPFVEQRYRVRTDVADRAVAGLSMGGGHALHLAFDHPGTFGAAGIWSPGWSNSQNLNLPTLLPRLIDSHADLASLKWVDLTCGDRDPRLFLSESLDAWFAMHDVPHTFEVVPGDHVWGVWRDALIRFVPKLFR